MLFRSVGEVIYKNIMDIQQLWILMVEAVGLEPTSEKVTPEVSPSAAYVLENSPH